MSYFWLKVTTIRQDSLPLQLTTCLQIPGVLQRLACYDRVAHSLPQRAVPAERPVARAVPPPSYAAPPPVYPAPPPGYGAPSLDLGGERVPRMASVPKRAQELTAGVAGVSYDARGRFTMTLDNGEVWRQLEGDSGVLRGSRISAVRISRGALGSYDLSVIGHNATFRVTRLQ